MAEAVNVQLTNQAADASDLREDRLIKLGMNTHVRMWPESLPGFV